VVPHGVGLGLGGADRPHRPRLDRLAAQAEACGAPLVSEHLAFVRAGGIEAGHLLPVPRTRDALDVVVENARQAVDALPVRLALEPIAVLADWPHAELTELAFLSELLDRVDVDLVLDVANMHVNAANRRRAGWSGPDVDPFALVEGLPLDRVAYVHAAGGRVVDGRHHDTHTDPLWSEVETLVEELWARDEIPGLLLERDGRFPPDDELRHELRRLDAAAARGRARRPSEGRPSAPARPSRPIAPPETAGEAAVQPARHRLAAAQEAFVRAVADAGPAPAGFDPGDLEAVAAVLVSKRASTVAHAAPATADLPAFAARFRTWAATRPRSDGCAACDGARFVRWLPPADRSPGACVAAVGAELDRPAAGRRRPARVRLRACRSARAVAVGIRLGGWQGVCRMGWS
jgi:uncharacterized protein